MLGSIWALFKTLGKIFLHSRELDKMTLMVLSNSIDSTYRLPFHKTSSRAHLTCTQMLPAKFLSGRWICWNLRLPSLRRVNSSVPAHLLAVSFMVKQSEILFVNACHLHPTIYLVFAKLAHNICTLYPSTLASPFHFSVRRNSVLNCALQFKLWQLQA